MKFNRRFFLATSAAQAFIFAGRKVRAEDTVVSIDEQYAALRSNKTAVPILQGMTTSTTAEFTVLLKKNEDLVYRVSDGVRDYTTRVMETHSRSFSEWSTQKIFAEGLSLGVTYKFRVEANGKLLDERDFMTLNLAAPQVKFALVSCMHDFLVLFQKNMWNSLASKNPDVLFLIGDEVYLDWGGDCDIESNWKRYSEVRRRLELFYFKKLIPTIAVWDDHDFGGDNTYGDYPHKEDSLQLFHAYFGSSETTEYKKGPANSKVLKAFGQQFYFLDDRYFSSPRGSSLDDQWGPEQEKWLSDQLSSSNSPAWIFNGIEFWGRYHTGESVERDRPKSLDRIKAIVRSAQAPVVFGCGDMHYTEVQKIEESQVGYETFEIMSSGIHNVFNPVEAAAKNPRRVASAFAFNFMVVESRPENGEHRFEVAAYGWGGSQHYSLNCSVKK